MRSLLALCWAYYLETPFVECQTTQADHRLLHTSSFAGTITSPYRTDFRAEPCLQISDTGILGNGDQHYLGTSPVLGLDFALALFLPGNASSQHVGSILKLKKGARANCGTGSKGPKVRRKRWKQGSS
ncbi:hypothetical protein BC567DRAFT_234059 [Phyllosticta citribraziliensis]